MAIAVDLDGTLAHYDGWIGADYIGPPILSMKNKVMEWIEQGEEVVIFTARASSMEEILYVREWLQEHNFPNLEITNVKMKKFKVIYDDRAYRVERNTGTIL